MASGADFELKRHCLSNRIRSRGSRGPPLAQDGRKSTANTYLFIFSKVCPSGSPRSAHFRGRGTTHQSCTSTLKHKPQPLVPAVAANHASQKRGRTKHESIRASRPTRGAAPPHRCSSHGAQGKSARQASQDQAGGQALQQQQHASHRPPSSASVYAGLQHLQPLCCSRPAAGGPGAGSPLRQPTAHLSFGLPFAFQFVQPGEALPLQQGCGGGELRGTSCPLGATTRGPQLWQMRAGRIAGSALRCQLRRA